MLADLRRIEVDPRCTCADLRRIEVDPRCTCADLRRIEADSRSTRVDLRTQAQAVDRRSTLAIDLAQAKGAIDGALAPEIVSLSVRLKRVLRRLVESAP
jgi:hypothetical protein